jgi:hypothetical protein
MNFQIYPQFCVVDQPIEVCVSATLDQPLTAGEQIAFALPESWSSESYCITYTKTPQFSDPKQDNYVTVVAAGAIFELALEKIPLPGGSSKGHVRKIIAKLVEGRLEKGVAIELRMHNYKSTWLAEEASFRVWVGNSEVTNPPRIRTIPAEAEKLRVIVPSSSKPDVPFRVSVVSYDRYWNRSLSTYRGGQLSLDQGSVLLEGISFTGSYETMVTISEPGIYWLIYDGVRSNPICITPNPHGPYWGDLHSHDKVHNCGAGEDPYTYARHASCLDFVAVSPDFRGLSPDVWRDHARRAVEAHEEGVFTTLVAYEAGFSGGHHNIYFKDTDGEVFDVTNEALRSTERLLATLDPNNVVVVPHHVGVHWGPQKGYFAERDSWISLVEIYSSHGLGETYSPEHALSYEFNRVRGLENKFATSVNQPVYLRDAWSQGHRYGVVASSDDHMGQPGKPMKGLAAVYASSNSREALFHGLKSRHTYGTTGERLILNFSINGQEMGTEIRNAENENMTINVEVHGTGELSFVEVARLRFGESKWEIAYSARMQDLDLFHENDPQRALSHIAEFTDMFTGDAIYYLRAGQRKQIDGWPVFAWSSPIWVTRGSQTTRAES